MRGSAAFRTGVAPGGALAGPWVRNPLWRDARAVPSLDLDFAGNKSLVDRVTGQSLVSFTRASSGTFVGSDGLIKAAATNEPRFDHNPTTGESLGLLVEEPRTNLNLYSEDFSNAIYTLTAATVSTNTAVAPDGTTTADTVTASGTAAVSQSFTKAASAITYTGSLFVKGSVADFNLTIDDGATVNRGRARFNLSTGTLGSVVNEGTFTGTTATITSFPNNWYRLTVTTTTNTLVIARLRSFWFIGGTSIDFWAAQLEAGAFPTSYIPTTGATATRAADVASITGAAFTSFYNQAEGTVFAEANVLSSSYSTGVLWDIGAGGAFGSTEYIGWIGTGWQLGPNAASINVASSVTATLPSRTATAIKLNDSIISASGLLGALDTSCTVPASATVLTIGKGGWSGAQNYVNGTIKRLVYWGQRLPNNVLQAITQP